jgi:RNA polymerase sigma-70 factor (ECF subfamily)
MMGLMAGQLVMNAAVQVRPRDFGAWMQSEQKRIFLLCHRLLGDRDEADTATQEVFLKAYRALSRPGAVDPQEPAKWLTRVAVNTCLDCLRSRRWKFWRKRVNPDDEQVILSLTASHDPSAEDEVFARQIAERLSKVLDKLSLRQRSVFTLRHYEDRSLEEIAEILQLDVGTVKAHLARAIAKLRAQLRDLYVTQRQSLGV